MPRNPNPVRPRRKDERKYEKAIRKTFLDPFFANVRGQLDTSVSEYQAIKASEQVVEQYEQRIDGGVDSKVVQDNLDGIDTYHRTKTIQTFRHVGIDISSVITKPEVQAFMQQKISENVNLIKTIPRRAHEGLKKRLREELEIAPFDRQMLTKVLREEFKSSGYNLRRIVRDQTTKTIGNLTEIRQRQMGLKGYEWSTSKDESVRETHQANEGQVFRWDTPPVATGHPGADIQCRCVAIAVVLKADRDRLPETK